MSLKERHSFWKGGSGVPVQTSRSSQRLLFPVSEEAQLLRCRAFCIRVWHLDPWAQRLAHTKGPINLDGKMRQHGCAGETV